MGRLGIRIANVLLASLCAFQLASVVNKIGTAALVPDTETVTALPAPVELPVRTWEDRQPILARNLFGAQVAGAAPPPEPEPEPDLEETKLPVQLLGTVLSGEREKSHAVIASRGAPEPELLREGDALEAHPQASIARIERRRVVLKNGGRYEELLLWEELEAPAPAPSRSRRAARRTPARDRRNVTARTAPSIVEQLQQLRVGGIGGQAAQDLLSQARITPHFEGGEMAGMEVRDIVPGSLYEKIGLSDGDVIQTFNGIRLDSDGAGAQILGQLGQADVYEIELSDGSTKTIRAGDLPELMGGGAGAPDFAAQAD